VALAVGWIFGFVASVLGLVGSVSMDMPAAPSILVTLTGLLLLMGGIFGLLRKNRGGHPKTRD
jgi:ABC-type Mn2+/Zn2+ transport system permease subunit